MNDMVLTGIEWCPEIPDDWTINKVKNCFYISKQQAGIKNPTVLKLARDGVKVRDISNNEGQLAESYDNYNPVKPGDLLLNPMDLYSGANCNMSEIEGVISPAYVILRRKVDLNPKFFDYYFKVQYWTMAMFAHGKGVSFDNRWTINAEGVKNYEIPFPSYEEQNKIVDYIEKSISKIDALISNQQQQIEKLKQYKQSLITEVVNKGLDRNVAMKDSGIDWAVKIPKNWRIAKLKMICSMQSGNNITSNQINPNEGRYPVYGGNGFRGYYDKYNIEGERCIIGRQGALAGNVHYVTGQYWATDHAVVVTPKGEVTNEYLYYVLIAMNLNRYAYETAAQPGLAVSKVENLLVPFPAQINEQKKIVSFIKKRCYDIDELVNVKLSKIEKLNQYKKSLIYEYVTGKKRVPEA